MSVTVRVDESVHCGQRARKFQRLWLVFAIEQVAAAGFGIERTEGAAEAGQDEEEGQRAALAAHADDSRVRIRVEMLAERLA